MRRAPMKGSCRNLSRERNSRSASASTPVNLSAAESRAHPKLWLTCLINYLQKNELVFVGSPQTVAQKIHRAAKDGVFNVFMGEFNFSDLPQKDLMRSIKLFGQQVVPALREYEPF